MRSFSTTLQNALLNRTVHARDFLWIVGHNRETGAAVAAGLWSDAGSVSAAVINPLSQQAETRDFEGAGTLVEIGDIPAVSNLTVQTISIDLSQIHPRVNEIVRQYDLKQARVEVFSGYLDPNSRALLEPALCRFQGFVDEVQITTPSENNAGSAKLTCTAHTSELTRSNPDTRSHDSQQLWAPGDGFFKGAAGVGDWNIDWGQASK